MTAVLKRFFGTLSRGDRRRFLLLAVSSLLPALTELLLTIFVAAVASSFVAPESMAKLPLPTLLTGIFGTGSGTLPVLTTLILLLPLIILLRNAVSYLQNRCVTAFSERVGRSISMRILKLIVYSPYQWHLGESRADLQFSLNATNRCSLCIQALLALLRCLLTVLLILAGIFRADFRAALAVVLLGTLGGLILIIGAKRKNDRVSAEICERGRRSNRNQVLALRGTRELKLFGADRPLIKRQTGEQRRLRECHIRLVDYTTLPSAAVETLSFAALPLLWFYLWGRGVSFDRIVVLMGLLVGAAWRVLPALSNFFNRLVTLRSLRPYLADVLKRLEEADRLLPDLQPALAAPDSEIPLHWELAFDRVSFHYPDGTPALQEASFTIQQGEIFGIIGTSGAGKSTVVNLLTGLLRPAAGRLTADGREITADDFNCWRKKIGYVPQAPYIFDGTLAENIALADYGRPIDRGRVAECCRAANIDFLHTMPQGLDTVIGVGEVRLSGGELQRVAIARALYVRPEILILDEATSALDRRNERAVIDTVLALRGKMTVLVIAHRLSAVSTCSRILWLEAGRVKKIGGTDILSEYQAALEE